MCWLEEQKCCFLVVVVCTLFKDVDITVTWACHRHDMMHIMDINDTSQYVCIPKSVIFTKKRMSAAAMSLMFMMHVMHTCRLISFLCWHPQVSQFCFCCLVEMPMCIRVQNLYIPQLASLYSPPSVVFHSQAHSEACGCKWITGHWPVACLNSLA